MKRTLWGGALAAVVAISFQGPASAQTASPQAASPAGSPASLSMDCHLLYRGVPMKEPTSYRVIGNELYGISGPIKTKLSQAGAPLSLGTSKEADGTTVESFASHTVKGTTLERTVFWKTGGGEMKPRFKEIYDFKAKTVMNSDDRSDFCHANGK